MGQVCSTGNKEAKRKDATYGFISQRTNVPGNIRLDDDMAVYQEIPERNVERKGFLAKQKRDDLSRNGSRKSNGTSRSAVYSAPFCDLSTTVTLKPILSRPNSKKSNATSRSTTFTEPFYQTRELPRRPDDYWSSSDLWNAQTSDYESYPNSTYGNLHNQEYENNSERRSTYGSLYQSNQDADPDPDPDPEHEDNQIWIFDSQDVGNREKLYPMNNKKRGYCIIFNVEDVGGRIRNGTNIDAKRMENSFKRLGFHVVVRQNPSRAVIISTMKGYRSVNHSNDDCFVCVILSHGRDGHIRATNNEDVSLQEVMDYVKNCRTLLGKPKLFFVQACRGNNVDHGITTDADGDLNNAQMIKCSSHTDVLVSYATVQDFVAYRDNRYGSIYIRNLSELLFQQGFTTKLTDILTQVTAMTSSALANVCQVPSFTSTLTKSLLFTRKKRVIKKTLHYDDGTHEEFDNDESLGLP
ncbi:CASP8 [Mytilus coruscus]|uniref:CASP8 n=1 Tax=Mytilus coruscus TaxID=42192 RepID=A0A6J8D2V0_MYTCO|nr:CASP8 [Mytilus coruscus]